MKKIYILPTIALLFTILVYFFVANKELVFTILAETRLNLNNNGVIVGREGWLYAVELSKETISANKEMQEKKLQEQAKKIVMASESWNQYLTKRGVKEFKIIIIPNKKSIYPEYLPPWARADSQESINAIISQPGQNLYIDTFQSLKKYKQQTSAPLFYKTDSLLTAIGSEKAFNSLLENITLTNSQMKLPTKNDYRLVPKDTEFTGSLSSKSRFFKPTEKELTDFQYLSPNISRQTINFDSKKILSLGFSMPDIQTQEIVEVLTQGALNNKKALWIQDTSSVKMAQLMSITFKDLLIIKWSDSILTSPKFLDIVRSWKPDYVFFTINQRNADDNGFTRFPPPEMFEANSALKENNIETIVSTNDLERLSEGRYEVTGGDPYIVFNLKRPTKSIDMHYLNIYVNCNENNNELPLQFFWQDQSKPSFSEEDSTTFYIKSKSQIIDLFTVPRWINTELISKVRLDFPSEQHCKDVSIKQLVLGH